nr:hypothetical protein CFP56_13612 [Quercus suber]
MTDAIWSFTEMRNRRGKKSTDTGESGVGANSESITQVVTLLNQHTDVDHVTYCKVVQELHNPKSRAAFFAMTVDRRRAWIEFIGGGLQWWWCDSVMADTDSNRDLGMAESDSDAYDSEVELEIATTYV